MSEYVFQEIEGYPGIAGNLEISIKEDGEIFIGGDPQGLKSLATVLTWLSEVDQEKTNMPEGEREHVHLRPKSSAAELRELTRFSVATEICRLDARESGNFPEYYYK